MRKADNPFCYDKLDEHKAWDAGFDAAIAEGRRLERRTISTAFHKISEWSFMNWLKDRSAARSKRGQRSAEIVAGEPKSPARRSGSPFKRGRRKG